jgi:hypothetical protein
MSVSMTKKRVSAVLGAAALSAALLGLTATPALAALPPSALQACDATGGTRIRGDEGCKFTAPWHDSMAAAKADALSLRGCENLATAGHHNVITRGVEPGSSSRWRGFEICE